MIKKEINFREAEESAYGLAYLQPYLENSPSKTALSCIGANFSRT